MEAVKATIQGKRTEEINGQKVYKHVLIAVIITDEPNRFVDRDLDVVMGESSLIDALSRCKRYVAPQSIAGGDAVTQLLEVSHTSPEDLEEIKE